jgi:hypothetical protein
MPGNTTQNRTPRFNFPTEWVKAALAAGQTTGVPMPMVGLSVIDSVPAPCPLSVVSAGIVLSEPVTNQFLEFRLTIDGVEQSPGIQMTSSNGSQRLYDIAPGKLTIQKGQRIGINWGSHPAMTPDGVIEALVVLEVQQS